MSDGQPTSDTLSKLRKEVQATPEGRCAYVDVRQLLALIECAEVMRTAYIYLVRDDRAKALKALTVLEQA